VGQKAFCVDRMRRTWTSSWSKNSSVGRRLRWIRTRLLRY